MLKDQEFLEEYRTGTNDFVNEFYKKAFSNSIEYWRADGKIKLITSVELTEDDSNAIEEGLSKQEVCEQRIQAIIETEFGEKLGTGVSKLAKLLEIDRLEIKIAMPKHGRGIYHEKVGLFFDENGNYLAFSGSANESSSAFEQNYECIDIYPSWKYEEKAKNKKLHFETLWNEINNDCYVFDFPEASKLEIIRKVNNSYPNTTFNDFLLEKEKHTKNIPSLPSWLELRDYQKKAINKWIQNDGHGLWAMATGSGKTITSLAAATHLLNSLPNGYVPLLVVVPYMHLVEQWANEGKNFNIDFIRCNSDYAHWENEINHALTNSIYDKKTLIPILTTTGTYKNTNT